jgi:hypothetical protein
MTVNAMNFEDTSTLLNSLYSQAIGETSITPTTTADFISMATTVLQAGVEPVNRALMQVVSRTIFASRPAARTFDVLDTDSDTWGGIIRKVSYYDTDITPTKALTFTDGTSVDMQTIRKPKAIETRFYGSDIYQDWVTRFDDQYSQAFTGPGQLGEFFAGVLQELNNKWNAYADSMERATIGNYMCAKKVGDSRNIIHLLTEYNAATGQTLTATDINKANNAIAFWQWVRSRFNTLARYLKQRSVLYHQNLTVDGSAINIPRITPADMMHLLITSEYLDLMNAIVLPNTYHDDPLKYEGVREVTYWQAQNNPHSISYTPVVMAADGTYAPAENTVTIDNIFAVIMDKDACRVNYKRRSLDPAPYNAAGKYQNTWLNVNTQYTNDMTENGIILCLD